jgi:hypothetical protein
MRSLVGFAHTDQRAAEDGLVDRLVVAYRDRPVDRMPYLHRFRAAGGFDCVALGPSYLEQVEQRSSSASRTV